MPMQVDLMEKKRAVLVCNGSISTKYLFSHISKNDFLIAVDGGANKLVRTGFTPDLIIGDMDSITRGAEKKFRESTFVRFSPEKDFVDLELAINYCIEKKFLEILILGAIGSRVDMTLTNVFLLANIPKKIKAKIVHENQEVFLAEKKQAVKGLPGEKISFFAVKEDVKGLTLKRCKYELENFDLKFGVGKGLSNEFKNKKTLISFKSGILLCVHFRKWF